MSKVQTEDVSKVKKTGKLTGLREMQKRLRRPRWPAHCLTNCCCAEPEWPDWRSRLWRPKLKVECQSHHCHTDIARPMTAEHTMNCSQEGCSNCCMAPVSPPKLNFVSLNQGKLIKYGGVVARTTTAAQYSTLGKR